MRLTLARRRRGRGDERRRSPPGPRSGPRGSPSERLDPDDPWLRVKTSVRGRYDRARAALPAGIDEWLFLNSRGEVCEGTITNVFVAREGVLLTPPLACGLLPGRAARPAAARGAGARGGAAAGGPRGRPVFVGNSLRGLIPARLVSP